MDPKSAEALENLKKALEKGDFGYRPTSLDNETHSRIVELEAQIERLSFENETLRNKLWTAEDEVARLLKMDFNANNRVAKFAEKAALTKKSLMGEIAKLKEELELYQGDDLDLCNECAIKAMRSHSK